MDWLAYMLTRKATDQVAKKVRQDGMREDSTREVRPVALYSWIFWLTGAFGLLLGGLACWAGQPSAGLVLFLLFGLLALPGLCMQYNCRLTYDEEGFVWRNLCRISRWYSYEEVTGVYSSPLRVVVELNGKKRLDFDESWINRQDFAKAIHKHRSQKPPKLAAPVLGMTNEEIEASYETGILAKALLVQKSDLPKFPRFKCVHYGICTLSVLCTVFAAFCGPAFEGAAMAGFLLLALPGLLLMVAALGLYARYPQYFTAREQPATEVMPSKEKKKRHKRCTMAVASLFSVPGGAIYFIAQVSGKSQFWPLWIAVLVAVVVLFGLLSLFRRYSWEYRNFGVGYVSFAVWQVMFCVSIFFAVGGLLVF